MSAVEEIRHLLLTPPPPPSTTESSTKINNNSNPISIAYASLQHLRDTLDPHHLFLRTLLELTQTNNISPPPPNFPISSNSELLFHCILGFRHVTLSKWTWLPFEFQSFSRDYLFYLGFDSDSEKWSRTVVLASLNASASFWKRSWVDTNHDRSGGTNDKNLDPNLLSIIQNIQITRITNKDDLFSNLENLLLKEDNNNDNKSLFLGCQFLSILVGEFSSGAGSSGISYNASLEFHKSCKEQFERQELNLILKLSMGALGKHIHSLMSLSNANNNNSKAYFEMMTAVVNLVLDVLSWEFGWVDGLISCGPSNSRMLIRPTKYAREYLMNPEVLAAILKVYPIIRSSPTVSHGIRQLWILLSSITGDIFSSGEERVGYASFLVEGFVQFITSLNDKTKEEVGDFCSMVLRLVMNFKLTVLLQCPCFPKLLTGLELIGKSLLGDSLRECESLEGDVESMEGEDWRLDAIGMTLEAVALCVEDTIFFKDKYEDHHEEELVKQAANVLSSTLSGLYPIYVTTRIRMCYLEEHYLTTNLSSLDEIREEISSLQLQEEMTVAASLGRLNLTNSLSSLFELFQHCLTNLNTLLNFDNTNNNACDITPFAAGTLEESRLLIVSLTHLLTDQNDGESPQIPHGILNACKTNPQNAQNIMHFSNSLKNLAEFQASKIPTNPHHPNLSPLMAKTLLWFFNRFVPAYILPQGCNERIIFGNNCESDAQTFVNFCVTLCLHYYCYWPQERQVLNMASTLLLNMARRDKEMRALLTSSSDWNHLNNLNCITTSLTHASNEAQIQFAIQNHPDPQSVLTWMRGYVRINYEDRANIICGLLIGNSDSPPQFQACLLAVQSSFERLISDLNDVNNKPISQSEYYQDQTLLLISLYTGIARASEIQDPERIPAFLTPSLPHLSSLMNQYVHDLTICEALLTFFRDYAERFISILTRDQSVTLFNSCVTLLQSYSEKHCAENRAIVKKSLIEVDMEEEQSYNDILCAIQLLIHLGTKDFIDLCGEEESGNTSKGVESSQVTDVIFFGLQQILPLMTKGLLQFPTLCSQYFSLVGFMMDTYPEKAAVLPFDLFFSLLESMLFGMSHVDVIIAKSSLRGIAEIFREHIKTGSLNGHLNHRPDLMELCSRRLLEEVIFQSIVWDRMEVAANVLLPLVAVNQNIFVGVVNGIISKTFNSLEKKERLETAFVRLLKPEYLEKVGIEGFQGRMNRLKFKNDFEVFVKDVHSFLVIK